MRNLSKTPGALTEFSRIINRKWMGGKLCACMAATLTLHLPSVIFDKDRQLVVRL